jgi:hypothetical protein
MDLAKNQIFYSANGVLIVDPNYHIDSTRLDDFALIEKFVLPFIYNRIHYPDIAKENAVSGMVITKIGIDSTGKIDIKIVKSNDYALDEAVTLGINSSMTKLIRYTKSMRLPFDFYIPFKFIFEMDTYNEDLIKNNAMTIKGRSLTKQYELIQH